VVSALKKLLADFGITKSAHAKMLFDDGKITQKVL
jgi:hypothetical protein